MSNSEPTKAEGFDNAIVGIDETAQRLIYDVNKCIAIIMANDPALSVSDAQEQFDYDVEAKYDGEHEEGADRSPIWMREYLG